MGLTTKTHRTFGTTLLTIWVVVGFILDGLQASPVRDHSSISEDSELQHLVDHRKLTRRETSILIDDSIKATSHNIREDIRPDPGPSVSFRSLSSLSSSRKSLTPSQKLRRTALSARSSLLSSLTGTNKRRKPLPLVRNHIDIKQSKKQEEIITTTISSLNGNTLDDFELLPLDNSDYYYDLDGEAMLLEEMLTTKIDTTASTIIVAETTPAPIEYTQTTSSKSTSTVSLSSSNKPVETTESAIPTSKTTTAIIEASTESTSENPIISTQRSVTASIHVSTSPIVSTTPFKTTAITPRSFRYTTLKPSLVKDQATVLLNRIQDLSSSPRTPNSEISPLIQNVEKLPNKAKTLKEHHITQPLQIHLLSDQLVVQISGAPKVTSQRQSRTKFKSSSSSTSSVGGSPSSTSTSSVGGSPISKSSSNVGGVPSSISTINLDNSASTTTTSSSLDISTSASSTTSKPRTMTLPVITSTTELITPLVPDIISEKNVEASRKSQSRSVSTSSVRLEVHTAAESAPVEVFEKSPSMMKNIANASPPLELIRQQGEAPLGLSPFGLSPLGPMPFGSHPQGQHPFGLHPQGPPRQANIPNVKSATTPKSTSTITPAVPPTTVNTLSEPKASSTTTSEPDSFPIPSATTNEKVGYVVAEENRSRFQLEQVTKDGFIIGEHGYVDHDNGAVSGVRYTADGSVDHKLIHDALQRFLSL